MKAQLTGSSPKQEALPQSQQPQDSPRDEVVDAELEALRAQLNKE